MRSRAPDVHLHLVGSECYDRECYQGVKRPVRENAEWVSLHEGLPREEMTRDVRHRYGIHGMQTNISASPSPSGAGRLRCSRPHSGGQVEIVGEDDRLRYTSIEDAVAKILGVLLDPEEQVGLVRHLASRKHLFTAERFVQRFQEIVAGFGEHSRPAQRTPSPDTRPTGAARQFTIGTLTRRKTDRLGA